MTSIIQLRNAYQAGTLPKPYFLGAVYALTQSLVEFQDALKGTQIREIIVGTDGLRIRTVDHDLELMLYPEEANSLGTGILAFGDAERLERRALLAAAQQSRVILDIGANVGWYSLHFARVAGEARIYAFEPAARIHARLLANLALNGITSVVTEQLALQDQEGTDTLYFHPVETGASSVRDNRGFTGVQPEEIRCTTLDLYCSRQGIRPDLIKCDVEGGELSVVRGAWPPCRNASLSYSSNCSANGAPTSVTTRTRCSRSCRNSATRLGPSNHRASTPARKSPATPWRPTSCSLAKASTTR